MQTLTCAETLALILSHLIRQKSKKRKQFKSNQLATWTQMGEALD